MCHALSHCRPLLHAALAALVVAALSRCSWEESRELAQLMRTVELLRLGNTAPVQAPLHDCDRESGCICRGATQAHAIDATHCNPVFSDLLPIDLSPAPDGWLIDLANTWPSICDSDSSRPPISGRQLRALYASLVI